MEVRYHRGHALLMTTATDADGSPCRSGLQVRGRVISGLMVTRGRDAVSRQPTDCALGRCG